MPAFINDGYTQEGFIQEVPGIHEAVRFTYRPATIVERRKVFDAAYLALPGDKQVERLAADVAKRILSWDIQCGDKPVEITADNLQRLTPQVFDRLTDIVHGATSGDDAKN